VVEQSKQQRIKAEIQQILDEQKWLEAESLTSSEDEETIFIEATTTQEVEEPGTATDAWLTSEDSAPMMLHATLHWIYCYDQDCQMHRFKDYYPLPRAQHYLCIGGKKS